MNAWGRRRSIAPAERRDSGVTLTEVLAVVVIIGVLASIVIVAVRGTRRSASESACAADRRAVERAVQLWSHTETGVPTMEQLATDRHLRNASVHFDVKPSGAVVARPSGGCAGFEPAPPPGDGAGGVAGGGGGGVPAGTAPERLEVALTWTGNADLDLWVRSPSGELVWWSVSPVGAAALDLDVVPPTPSEIGPHTERIVWPAGTASHGEYVAWPRFESAGWGPQTSATYSLTIRLGATILATDGGPIGAPDTVGPAVRTLLD